MSCVGDTEAVPLIPTVPIPGEIEHDVAFVLVHERVDVFGVPLAAIIVGFAENDPTVGVGDTTLNSQYPPRYPELVRYILCIPGVDGAVSEKPKLPFVLVQ